MSEQFSTMREIGIDAGHRVPEHKSKCCFLHGHRYTVRAYVKGQLAGAGEQTGMTLDFGFLKEEMMEAIDEPCDHGTILRYDDPLVDVLVQGVGLTPRTLELRHQRLPASMIVAPSMTRPPIKLYLVEFSPTAENLARHWFELLAPRVAARSEGRATLASMHVGETPNCWASFPACI